MGRSDSKPTIRILILGAAGVGKNCLESRFTTTTYPPLYNPALTINSRRFFTLSPRPSSPPEPTTRPLDTSYGLPTFQQTSFGGDLFHILTDDKETGPVDNNARSRTASSTFSNPASMTARNEEKRGPSQAENTTNTTTTSNRTSQPQAVPISPPSSPPDLEAEETPEDQPCPSCLTEANTYLVELTNYPALQLRKVRRAVYAKGEYDAVMLVYDVGSRASFDAVPALAGEIPHCRRNRKRMSRRESVAEGLSARMGAEGEKGPRERVRLRRRSSAAVFEREGGGSRAGSAMGSSHQQYGGYGGGGVGSGETVVALVGNKADFDAEYASVDFGLEAKRAALEEVDVEERGLVHPLYRESQLYHGELDAEDEVQRLSRFIPPPRRPSQKKRDTFASATSTRPLLSPVSGRSFAIDTQTQELTVPVEGVDEEVDEGWPVVRKFQNDDDKENNELKSEEVSRLKFNPTPRLRINNLDASIRRSAMSADYHGPPAHRTSVLSKRSVRTMQEGSKPLVLAKLPKTEAIENWIRTGSPTTAEHPVDDDMNDDIPEIPEDDHDQECTRVGTQGRRYSTTTTAASKRQVSRIEGEMLARTLLLNVPFYETSAKTGENVEEAFEAVVREVLREQGRDVVVDPAAVYAKCKRRHGVVQKTGPTRTRPPTVERVVGEEKRKRKCERRDSWPEVLLPEEVSHDSRKIVVDTNLHELAVETSESASPVSPQRAVHKRRRDSMLDRFRKVFSRRSVVMVADVPG